MSKSKDHALNYMKKFTNDIKECRDVNDYYDLVGSVFIFAELVHIHFKEQYALDNNNPEAALIDLRNAAKIVAEDIVSGVLVDNVDIN